MFLGLGLGHGLGLFLVYVSIFVFVFIFSFVFVFGMGMVFVLVGCESLSWSLSCCFYFNGRDGSVCLEKLYGMGGFGQDGCVGMGVMGWGTMGGLRVGVG